MKLSFEQIRSLLYEAIQPTGAGSAEMSCWIKEVYEDEFVYHKGAKLYKAPYKIEDGKAEIGTAVEVEEEVEYVPVFSVERLFAAFKETRDDGSVVRRGKIFEVGDFPDKNVAFDDGDLDHAVNTFQPVENDLEHASTILDGKLGRLSRVWKRGQELFGEVELPAWLDKAIGDEAIKVSLAFDRAKRIVGNALVLRPRIADAAIMSAFSSSHPSVISKGDKPEEHKPMKLKDAIKHLFGLVAVEDLDVEVNLPEGLTAPTSPAQPLAATPETPAPDQAPAPAFSAEQDARFKALEAQFVKEKAYAFADGVIRDKKVLPAQRDQVAGMFTQAVTADADGGPLFSAEAGVKEGKNVETLKAFFNAAPPHAFVGEAFVNDVAVLHFGGHGDGGMDKDKKDKLLSMSALGRKGAEVALKN